MIRLFSERFCARSHDGPSKYTRPPGSGLALGLIVAASKRGGAPTSCARTRVRTATSTAIPQTNPLLTVPAFPELAVNAQRPPPEALTRPGEDWLLVEGGQTSPSCG